MYDLINPTVKNLKAVESFSMKSLHDSQAITVIKMNEEYYLLVLVCAEELGSYSFTIEVCRNALVMLQKACELSTRFEPVTYCENGEWVRIGVTQKGQPMVKIECAPDCPGSDKNPDEPTTFLFDPSTTGLLSAKLAGMIAERG